MLMIFNNAEKTGPSGYLEIYLRLITTYPNWENRWKSQLMKRKMANPSKEHRCIVYTPPLKRFDHVFCHIFPFYTERQFENITFLNFLFFQFPK